MPALRWSAETGFAHEAAAIERAMALGVGGFILFGGEAHAVRALVTDLRAAARHPILIGSDLERGAGQQFAGLTELPPPRALATLDDTALSATAGLITASEARSVGVDWVFAPDADLDHAAENPIVQTRSFGSDPADVAAHVAAWVRGCAEGGALACAKHFPGHGRTTQDSHAELPVVDADLATLEGTDWLPFRAAIEAGVPSVMTGHIAFPALDRSGLPATLSPVLLAILRERLAFEGAIVSDALIMEGAFAATSEGEAYARALAAGVDVLLYPRDVAGAVAAIAGGAVPAARLDAALARREALLDRAARLSTGASREGATFARDVADRIVAAGVRRGALPAPGGRVRLVVVDDDVGGPYPPSPSHWFGRALEAAGVTLADDGVPVVAVFAEPRAWKGRAGLGAASRAALDAWVPGAALVVLFGHERLLAELPAGPPVLLAWHRQRPLQEAAARVVAG